MTLTDEELAEAAKRNTPAMREKAIEVFTRLHGAEAALIADLRKIHAGADDEPTKAVVFLKRIHAYFTLAKAAVNELGDVDLGNHSETSYPAQCPAVHTTYRRAGKSTCPHCLIAI